MLNLSSTNLTKTIVIHTDSVEVNRIEILKKNKKRQHLYMLPFNTVIRYLFI